LFDQYGNLISKKKFYVYSKTVNGNENIQRQDKKKEIKDKQLDDHVEN
jgi:hypothetical protein